jgi:hypothetical protein
MQTLEDGDDDFFPPHAGAEERTKKKKPASGAKGGAPGGAAGPAHSKGPQTQSAAARRAEKEDPSTHLDAGEALRAFGQTAEIAGQDGGGAALQSLLARSRRGMALAGGAGAGDAPAAAALAVLFASGESSTRGVAGKPQNAPAALGALLLLRGAQDELPGGAAHAIVTLPDNGDGRTRGTRVYVPLGDLRGLATSAAERLAFLAALLATPVRPLHPRRSEHLSRDSDPSRGRHSHYTRKGVVLRRFVFAPTPEPDRTAPICAARLTARAAAAPAGRVLRRARRAASARRGPAARRARRVQSLLSRPPPPPSLVLSGHAASLTSY